MAYEENLFRKELNWITNEFNERLKAIMQGGNTNYKPLKLGIPSIHLLNSGIPNLQIEMSVQRLIDKKLQFNHPFKLVNVVHLPEFIAFPIAIFRSKTGIDSYVILTEMVENAINMVVIIEINRELKDTWINSVRSIYPKDNIKDVLRWIVEDGLLIYCNKQKALDWVNKQQSNSADVAQLIKDCIKIINNGGFI